MNRRSGFSLFSLAAAALLTATVVVVPTTANALTCPKNATGVTMRCGSYSVSGLGSRKTAVRNAGADTLDLAVAMLETETMQTNYTYGDGKSGDAANFGIFKANWMMIRTACSQFKGQSASQYNNGSALNSNLANDVKCLNQSQAYYGSTLWWAGHRNGASGLSKPNTNDIKSYRLAVEWIYNQLSVSPSNLSNNTRFWVSVPAI